jgi:hypothetical protein
MLNSYLLNPTGAASLAIVEEPTGINRHHLGSGVFADRTGYGRFQDHAAPYDYLVAFARIKSAS